MEATKSNDQCLRTDQVNDQYLRTGGWRIKWIRAKWPYLLPRVDWDVMMGDVDWTSWHHIGSINVEPVWSDPKRRARGARIEDMYYDWRVPNFTRGFPSTLSRRKRGNVTRRSQNERTKSREYSMGGCFAWCQRGGAKVAYEHWDHALKPLGIWDPNWGRLEYLWKMNQHTYFVITRVWLRMQRRLNRHWTRSPIR